MMTFLPLEEIDAMDAWQGSELNRAKEILAYELTRMIHGEEEAQKAEAAAKALFAGGAEAEVPTTALAEGDFTEGKIDIVSLLVAGGLVPSRSEGRRAVEQGGVTAGDSKVTDFRVSFEKGVFAGEGLLVRKGKKGFRRFVG
jgi:tyrosyl-tRNA synthetase